MAYRALVIGILYTPGTMVRVQPKSDVRIGPKGKVFRDPVHGLIRIEPGDDFILDLIDTPEFQRLRRIRQLGVSFLTYHGAEHSRFAHSMGVFNFAQRILQSLRRRYQGENGVTECLEEHARSLKAAALLHDVGHGPFSHMIERAFEDTADHEARTVELVTDRTFGIGEVLERHDIDAPTVADIVRKTHPCPLIIDIVSSQLDADRMDYLLRDSLYTGVEYGRYDAEWIINSLCIGNDPTPPPPQEDEGGTEVRRRWRLCLDGDRGLYSAEQLILARAHMHMQVYFHRVTRGYEVLLLNLFKEAERLGERLPRETPGIVRRFFQNHGQVDHTDWLHLDEAAIIWALHAWADSSGQEMGRLRRFAGAFLTRQRLYQGVGVPRNPGLEWARDLERALSKAGLEEWVDWTLDDAKHTPYKDVLWSAAKGKSDDAETTSAESILLSSGDPNQQARPAEANSDVLKKLRLQAAQRLYYDRSKKDQFRPVLKRCGIELT